MANQATRVLLLMLFLLGVNAASIKRTRGIFGAIQFSDKTSTVSRLLEQCYAGFALNGCEDLNATTSSFHKDYAFSSQFTDATKRNQQYCLQCCSEPTQASGADETWNLSCPLNDLQRLIVSKGRRLFRFARRNSLDDEAVVECAMPNRTVATYLEGYALTLWIIERSINFGSKYWRSVVNCSVSITETATSPTKFSEVIRIRSIPTQQPRPTAWVAPFFLSLVGLLLLVSVPVYNAGYRGQRCLHCGSWLVVARQMCITCICISCNLQPPPAKVYVDRGDPHKDSTVDEDDGGVDSSDSDSDSSEESAAVRKHSIKNIKTSKSGRNK